MVSRKRRKKHRLSIELKREVGRRRNVGEGTEARGLRSSGWRSKKTRDSIHISRGARKTGGGRKKNLSTWEGKEGDFLRARKNLKGRCTNEKGV